MGGGTYGLIVAMHAAVWLVQGPGTPRCYVFLQGGYGGGLEEVVEYSTRINLYCQYYIKMGHGCRAMQ